MFLIVYLVPSLYRKVLFIESGEGAGAGVLDDFLFWRIGYWASFISRDIEFRAGFCLFFLEVHLGMSWFDHFYLYSLLGYIILLDLGSLDNFSVDADESLI